MRSCGSPGCDHDNHHWLRDAAGVLTAMVCDDCHTTFHDMDDIDICDCASCEAEQEMIAEAVQEVADERALKRMEQQEEIARLEAELLQHWWNLPSARGAA